MESSLRELWQRSFPEVTAAPDPDRSYRPSSTEDEATAPLLERGSEAVPSGYVFLDELGAGGMGTVYRGRQVSLDREVAIKTSRGSARRAFLSEAYAMGCLDHPNIVPAYALENSPRGAILVMKVAAGADWRSLLDSGGVDLEGHIELLVQVCNAVAFAHSKGIAHLDLKPENVLIGDFGEVQLMDWGLAIAIGDGPPAALRRGAEINTPCGTPRFMAPEQAEGRGDRLGAATDVYLLGALLFHILEGRPPHDGEGLWTILAQATAADPPSFSKAVPEELALACRQAMAREPSARFTSVQELRSVLASFLEHRQSRRSSEAAVAALARVEAAVHDPGSLPLDQRVGVYEDLGRCGAAFEQALSEWTENPEAARGLGRTVRLHAEVALAWGDLALAENRCARLPKTAETRALQSRIRARRRSRSRQRRLIAGLIALLALGALGVVLGLGYGFQIVSLKNRALESAVRGERAQAAEARAARTRTAAALAESQENLARSLLERGRALIERRALLAAKEAFARSLAARDTAEARLGLFAARQASFPRSAPLDPPPDRAWTRLVPSSKRIALFDDIGGLWRVGDDGPRRVAPGLGPLRTLAHNDRGEVIAWVSGGRLRVHSFASGATRELGELEDEAPLLGFDSEGRWLSAFDHGRLRSWIVRDGFLALDIQAELTIAPPRWIATMPGRGTEERPGIVALAAADGIASFDAAGGRDSLHLERLGRGILKFELTSLTAGPGGFFAGLKGGKVMVHPHRPSSKGEDAFDGWSVHRAAVEVLDGALVSGGLVSASATGELAIWQAEPFTVFDRIPGSGRRVKALAFDREGGRVFVGDEGGEVRVWREDFDEITERFRVGETMDALALDPARGLLVVSGSEGLRAWRERPPDLSTINIPDLRLALDAAEARQVKAKFNALIYGELAGASPGTAVARQRSAFLLGEIRGLGLSPNGETIIALLDQQIAVLDSGGGRPRVLEAGGPLLADQVSFVDDATALAQRSDGALLVLDGAAGEVRGSIALRPSDAWVADRSQGRLFTASAGRLDVHEPTAPGVLSRRRLAEGLGEVRALFAVKGRLLAVAASGVLSLDPESGDARAAPEAPAIIADPRAAVDPRGRAVVCPAGRPNALTIARLERGAAPVELVLPGIRSIRRVDFLGPTWLAIRGSDYTALLRFPALIEALDGGAEALAR